MARDISNHDDVIDSRDVIARIEELEALRKPWVAGCNMPGYMPDSEPCGFESWEDAQAYIIEDLERQDDGETTSYELAAAIEAVKAAKPDQDFGETIGSWHYWINRVENEDCFEDKADFEELQALKSLAEEADGYSPDWTYGATLIRDSYFTDYAQELCEDCGDVGKDLPHYVVIDWEATARNIRQDYTSVEFDGVTYWVR